MKGFNRITIVGRLGDDPKLVTVPSGTSMAKFPVATSYRTKDADETQWHKVIAWGKVGEQCAQYLKKGNPVHIEGTLRSHQYDGKDGAKRVAFEVHAERVDFLEGRSKKTEAVAPAQEGDLVH